jgi:1-phosphofructokinase family hexose kinase
MHLEGLLINEGVKCDFVKIPEETRSNVIVFTQQSREHVSLNSKGPCVGAYPLASLFEKIMNLSKQPSCVLLGGSIPQGVSKNIYAQIIYTLRQKGIKVALDADNEPLRLGVEEGPFIIKPNTHEFSRLVGQTLHERSEIVAAGRQFMEKGVEIIIVSQGARGLLVFNREEAHFIEPPKVEANSTVGSGDSTLAAFLLAWEQGKSLQECGIMGAAAGAATAMSPGVELVRKSDFDSTLPRVRATRLAL